MSTTRTPSPEAAIPRFLDAASEETRARQLADRLGLPYVDLWTFRIDAELFRSIPLEWMLRFEFVPEKAENGSLAVVMADPADVVKRDELEGLLKKRLSVRVGSRAALQDILQKSESTQRVLEEATEEFRMQVVREDEEGQEVLSIDRITADASPIIKLVDSVLFNAIQRRASDIHIETQEHVVVIKYRIDGVLYPAMEPIDKKHHQTIISRIKVMSELDIAEKRIPQDGRFKVRVKGRTIDFRVSIMPTVHGEDAVIRILDKESANAEFKNLRLDVLGMDQETMRRLRKFIREPYGMVLVTGPTGSGKTTTLYACLSEIQSVEDKIITIEDPVEYQLRGMTQIPVQAALTGHLVFTTVHANNVVDVLGRFLNMKVELYNFVSALNCILAQRLVRKICPHCRVVSTPTVQLLEESAIAPEQMAGVTLYEGRGCIECNGTGFYGRMAITALLVLSDRILSLILDRRPAAEIKKAAQAEGMSVLRESAIKKVLAGQTTLREINKVTFVE